MTINAGKLRERVTLLRLVLVDPNDEDDYGQKDAQWTSLGGFWAGVDSKPKDEAFESQQQQSGNNITVTLRQGAITRSLTVADRLMWQGQEYEIGSVDIDRESRDAVIIEASHGA